MRAPMLQTKLYMPHLPPGYVARARLAARLGEGVKARRALTLLAAPAGYGKSSLVVGWLDGALDTVGGHACAWLSLDDEDNDPERFLGYLLAALRRAGRDVAGAEAALLSFDAGGVNDFMTVLLNDLAGVDTTPPAQPAPPTRMPTVLVLDDYHRIGSPVIHGALQFWLDHAPRTAHLVVITREDPPFNLARLRAARQLTELRARDLRFTDDEAARFLNESMQLDLAEDDLAALITRTEGWIAGLQLAALAMQTHRSSAPSGDDKLPFGADVDAGDALPGGEDASLIAAVSGTHFYIIDYLLEEVLRRQPDTVREFLRRTAVLDRLCAPLCDAVTGRDDGAAMLAHLERHNLFLIPLDNAHTWYRYHHLLADALLVLLDDAEQAELQQRAALWFEANDAPVTAVRHALASGDLTFSADMMARVIQRAATWSRGEVARLAGWLDALPPPLLHARPALAIHASRALYLAGDLARAAQLLSQAAVALDDATVPVVDRPRLRDLSAVYQAAIAALRGHALPDAIAAVEPVLAARATRDPHTAARAADTLGLALELRGDVRAAEAAYLRAATLAQSAGVRYLAVNARCEAALVQIEQGDLARADATCRDALRVADGEAIPPTGLAWAVLGAIALERNDLATADAHLAKGIKLSQAGGITDDLRHAYLFLTRLRLAQGDLDGARTAWRQADRLLARYNVARLAGRAAAYRARLDLAQGHTAQARQWADAYLHEFPALPADVVGDGEELTLVQVLLATAATAPALQRAEALGAVAEAQGRLRTVIAARALAASAHWAMGASHAAIAALRQAVTAAAPAGFVRLFLDVTPDLGPLLPAVRDDAPALTDALSAHHSTPLSASTHTVPPALAEPLSAREEEVLALLVDGCSNQEIADALVITLGTAKWHVHNIYQKLGVAGRAELIALAHRRAS